MTDSTNQTKTPKKELFNHEEHERRLEEAAEYLASVGKDDLASAVRQARSLHIDWISRMAEGRRVRKRIAQMADKLMQEARVMDEYVISARGPCFGKELFAKGWPGDAD